jgi:hypothetical protein
VGGRESEEEVDEENCLLASASALRRSSRAARAFGTVVLLSASRIKMRDSRLCYNKRNGYKQTTSITISKSNRAKSQDTGQEQNPGNEKVEITAVQVRQCPSVANDVIHSVHGFGLKLGFWTRL